MTLAELLQALITASPNGVLDPYAPAPDPNNLLTALPLATAKFGPSPAVSSISNLVAIQSGDAVTATGSATFAIPGAPGGVAVTVQIVATLPTADAPLFALSLAGPRQGWTFATTFPDLPKTQLFQGGLLPWGNSYLSPVQVDAPSFTASSAGGPTVDFSGSLPIAGNGALDDYAQWIGPGPLPLSGTIALPQAAGDFPAADLFARISGARLAIGSFTVQDLGLRLQSEIGLDPSLFGVTSRSSLSLVATLTLGGITARLSAPLLQGDVIWPLYLAFQPPQPLSSGGLRLLSGLFEGLPADQFPVPQGLPILDDFFIANIGVGLAPPTSDHMLGGMHFVSVTLGSNETWNPPVPYVNIANVGMRWVASFGGDAYAPSLEEISISGCVYGDVIVGSGAPPDTAFAIRVEALIPQFVITGELANDDSIPLDNLLSYFFNGGTGPVGPFKNLKVTALSFEAAPREQTYRGEAAITTDVTVPLGGISIKLQKIFFWIDSTQGGLSGGLSAVLQLEGGAAPAGEDPLFLLSANYGADTGESGWNFAGRLYDGMAVDLTHLVERLLNITAPDWVPHLLIEKLLVEIQCGSQHYHFAGVASARWPAQVLGIENGIAIVASADIQRAPDSTTQQPVLTGTLSGGFTISKIEIGLATDIGAPAQTFRFTARFDKLLLQVTTGQRTSKGAAAPHQVLYARLGGVTLGGILEYLVNLAAPTVGFKLDPPWDLLNRIDLSRFQLMFDPTESAIEVTCDIGADILVMRIDKIGVRYARPGGKPTVELILDGSFLGQSRSGDDAVAWNVIDDPPPAVPGQGTSLIDLRYLGLGQRVSFADSTFNQLDTVRSFLNELAQQMRPVTDPSANPLTQNPGIAYAPDSEWLIGLDLTLMDTLDLGLLFNDPKLYGLSIGLHGDKAGSMAGLDFEILYKRISNDVGMFRIELKLPDKFRRFEFGTVSVTLGTIVLEIYTNGDFQVDFGFPYNRDYARSFSIEMIPFIGRGGLYFGLLDGSTSRRTPIIVNGAFAPVIELGVGVAMGVGKEVSFGPLSGGAYVEIEASFQGVLAWFNPSDSSVSSDKYYWAQAVVAIHGRIYGEVDFIIVKASANIEAYAEAAAILEAFRATLLRLAARVEVSASVDILFISIDFSFSASIDLSFTVGQDSTTPWILAADQGGRGGDGQLTYFVRSRNLPAPRRSVRRRNANQLRRHLLTRAASLRGDVGRAAIARVLQGSADYQLVWNPDTTVFSSPRTVPITLVAAGSVAGLPAVWSGAAPPLPADPVYRLAFVATAANGLGSYGAARSVSASAHARVIGELASDTLMEALLRWSISAVAPGAANVTAAQIQLLADQMTSTATTAAFTTDNLATFFSNNIVLQVGGPPSSGPAPTTYGAGLMPMPPFLNWQSTQAPGLGVSPSVGPLYEWGANGYFTQFQNGGDPGPQPSDDPPTGYESLAAFVFRDWCLMLARTAVRAALGAMSNYSYALTTAASLADIANALPKAQIPYTVRAGDTTTSVALALGVTAAELIFQNGAIAATLAAAAPGEIIEIAVGVSPGEVAADNPTLPLASQITLALGDLDYQAPAGATLTGIATLFGLANAAALFTGTTLADDAKLLAAGARFTAPAASYPNAANFSLLFAAAIFYVRTANRIDVPDADWYAQAIFQLNSAAGQPLADWTGIDLPVGATLRAPSALNTLSAPITYVTQPGDSLARLGAALSLAQNFATSGEQTWVAYLAAVTAANPDWTTGAIALPALPAPNGAPLAVADGESLAMLGRRLILFADDLPGLLAWIAGQAVLAPLAIVPVPNVSVTTAGTPADSFASLAARYGMTIADFATIPAVANSTTLLPFGPTATVTISHLAAQSVSALVSAVMAGDAPVDAAGMTARQLLSGQYLPAPEPTSAPNQVAATGALTPLLDLTGQQVNGPTPDSTQPAAVAFAAAITVQAGYPWITLVDSMAAGPDDRLDQLRARLPRLDVLNPAVGLPGRLAAGMLLHTDTTETLNIQFTNADLTAMYPATGLALAPTRGPLAMPATGKAPRTYGLDHRTPLQSPAGFAFTPSGAAPLIGEWSLWDFPSSFETRAQAGTATPYELARRETHEDRPQATDLILNATWATTLPFRIRRMGDARGLYELVGADTGDRQSLLALCQRLAAEPTSAGYLLYAPAPASASTVGLAAAQPDPNATYIVKSNLGTETHSGFASLADARSATPRNPNAYFASFAELPAFCTLLWEASVVGGAGYFLAFHDSTGGPLADSAFDETGVAVLRLMVLDATQLEPAPSGRTLLPTNNCALIAPGLDSAINAIFTLAADDTDDIDMPVFAAGNVGFTVTLPQPPQNSGATAADLLAAQFGLMSYNIAALAGSPFAATQPAPPISPQKEDGAHMSLPDRIRLERRVRAGVRAAPAGGDATYWRFDQALPLYRFGPGSVAPPVTGLPLPAQDPYNGVGSAAATVTARVQLDAVDVFGNPTAPASGGGGGTPPGAVDFTIGYTDPMFGVSNWPNATSSYALTADDSGVALAATIGAQAGALAPSFGQTLAHLTAAAGRQAARYGEIYYQMVQSGVTPSLLTTLVTANGAPVPQSVDQPQLALRFVAASYLYAGAVAALQPVPISATAAATLGDITTAYGVGPAQIGEANAAAMVYDALGAVTLTVPVGVAFADGDSASSIVAAAQARQGGWPAPATAAALLSAAQNADILLLRPQTVLAFPPATFTVPADGLSFGMIATAMVTTSVLLAADTAAAATQPSLVTGFVFTYDHASVTVADGQNTLAQVVAAFAGQGVVCSLADIVAANDAKPGMFASGAVLITAHLVCGADDTLADAAATSFAYPLSPVPTLADFATANATSRNLFDAGAQIYLGPLSVSVGASDLRSFGDFANAYGCTIGDLLAANPTAALPATTTLLLPGAAAMPASPPPGPYACAASDLLSDIAVNFATTAEALGAANAAMPYTIAGGQQLTILGHQIATVTGWSFDDLWNAAKALDTTITFAETIAAMARVAGALQDGALMLCPPAQPPVPTGGMTIGAFAALYHLEPLAVALANAGTAGLIAAGVALSVPLPGGGAAAVTTGAHDTFNAILARFAAQGVAPSLADILAANPTAALIGVGACALLPPPPSVLTAQLPAGAGPFPGPIFPLQVWLRVARPTAALAPGVDATGPVALADSPVAAPATPKESGSSTTLTFDAFAAAFVAALPNLRLATSRVAGETADLWAVDFGSTGIAQVTVAPGLTIGTSSAPCSYALRPLHNTLQSRLQTPVQTVNADGTLSAPANVDFQNVDSEPWAARFLADMDLFLSGPYAGALYADTSARASLAAVLDAKAQLAAAIAGGVWPVLDIGMPQPGAAVTQALDAMQERLAVSLSQAYATAALIQYDATVTSVWTSAARPPAPARLSGAPFAATPAPADPRPFTLTSAKTDVSAASSYTSFAMAVPDASSARYVPVNLGYAFDEMEFDITPVPEVTGYVESDWLSFVPSLQNNPPTALQTDLGAANIPIPLRAYPPLPAIRKQTARATPPADPSAPTLPETRLWSYGLTYLHQHAAQDEVRIGIETNIVAVTGTQLYAPEDNTDVVRALAAYMAAADGLWALLPGWLDPTRQIPMPTLVNAAASFATLAGKVGNGWASRWTVSQGRGGGDDLLDVTPAYGYRVRVDYTSDDGLAALSLTSEAGGEGPGGTWPAAFYTPPGGTPIAMPLRTSTATMAVYAFPLKPDGDPYHAGTAQCIGFEWGGLDVTQIQNARAKLSVMRNTRLLGEDGPATNRDFVFQTPDVTAAEIVWPLLDWPNRFLIGSGAPSGFVQALGDALTQILGAPDGQTIALAASYAYELVPPAGADKDGVVTYLPVKLLPAAGYAATTASDLAAALESWRTTNNPNAQGSEWAVALNAYADVDASQATGKGRPLLQIARLIYQLTQS